MPVRWEGDLVLGFVSPDGRATFELVQDDQGLIVRWRRIGDHSVYRTP